MPNQETKTLDNIIASRRALLLSGGAAALAALAMPRTAAAYAAPATFTDTDILNFALNLEYLEANFYYLAAFGTTIDVANANSTAAGAMVQGLNGVLGNGSTSNTTAGVVASFTGTAASNQVPFQVPLIAAYAAETAIEEGKHVAFLRGALGTAAVAQPALSLTVATFQAAAQAAGISIYSSFNPYANDIFFLLGAYIFEDVGVSAYHGAAPLITNKTGVLVPAVGIHAVEAYHAGLVRTTITAIDSGALVLPTALASVYASLSPVTATAGTVAISGLRNTLSQALRSTNTLAGAANPEDPTTDDYGCATQMVALPTGTVTATQIVDADPTMETSFGRSVPQVLNIVTGGHANASGTPAAGLFYPNGLNGLFI